MRILRGTEAARGLPTLHGCNAQRGHIEIGSVLVIVAVLGVIAYMGVTDTAWGDLSLLGKGIIVGIIAAAVFAAWVFNESSAWPNVNLGETAKKPEKNESAGSDGRPGP